MIVYRSETVNGDDMMAFGLQNIRRTRTRGTIDSDNGWMMS